MSAQETLWAGRVVRAVETHRERLKAVGRELGDIQRKLAALSQHVESEERDFDEQLGKLYERQSDPVVLTGSRSFIYHSADSPCGQAPTYPHELLWSEARERGLLPCMSCGRDSDREAEKVRTVGGTAE